MRTIGRGIHGGVARSERLEGRGWRGGFERVFSIGKRRGQAGVRLADICDRGREDVKNGVRR